MYYSSLDHSNSLSTGELGIGKSYLEKRKNGPSAVIGEIQQEWKVNELCMGHGHCIVLTTSLKEFPRKKKVWFFGNNNHAQRGNGSEGGMGDELSIAEVIRYFVDEKIEVVKIACGSSHNAVITAEGVLLMWGNNTSGCGNGSKEEYIPLPTVIHFLNSDRQRMKVRCLDVSCSRIFNMALCEDRTEGRRICYSWGVSSYGMLGHDDAVGDCGSPLELLTLSHLEDDSTVVRLGLGDSSSFCIVEKSFFHLNDVFLQDDKIEFLRDFMNMN